MATQRDKINLPTIPDKRYFTIGEVSELCGVKPHVLRYWEQEFNALSPSKRRGNRRYYQHQDVLMIRNIRSLLYEQGYTIGGARLQINNSSKPVEIVNEQKIDVKACEHQPLIKELKRELQQLLIDLG